MKFSPPFDPIAFKLPFTQIHITWYALMYLIAFVCIVFVGVQKTKKANSKWTADEVKDMAFYLFIGAILGGRLGYILFYNLSKFIQNPLLIIGFDNGQFVGWAGMSFHGGLLGVLLATFFIAKSYKKTFWQMTDFIAPLIPIGLFFGRIGNFINHELWGKATNQNWGFAFQQDLSTYRHPSQLYEAGLEGIALFLILWFYSRKPRPRCAISGLFLIGYGVFRFIVEFFRVPDDHLNYLFSDWFTMGMLLCIPMIIAGIGLIIYAYKVNKYETVS